MMCVVCVRFLSAVSCLVLTLAVDVAVGVGVGVAVVVVVGSSRPNPCKSALMYFLVSGISLWADVSSGLGNDIVQCLSD